MKLAILWKKGVLKFYEIRDFLFISVFSCIFKDFLTFTNFFHELGCSRICGCEFDVPVCLPAYVVEKLTTNF